MDIDGTRLELNQKRVERDNLKAEIARLEDKKAILDKAYEKLANAKRQYKRMKQNSDDANMCVTYWKGDQYAAYVATYGEITSANDSVYKQVDKILDDINRKRNELWNQIGQKRGLLLGVIRKIGYLKTEIQNWGN